LKYILLYKIKIEKNSLLTIYYILKNYKHKTQKTINNII
jgi:hypothetical protein